MGLDPDERLNLKNLVSGFAEEKIIIFATHIVSDVEGIADRVVIINRGNILVNEETESVVNKTETKVWQCSFKDIKEISYIKSKYRVSREQHHKGVVDMRIISDVKPCENAVETSASLEEAYLKIIGNKRNDTNEKS